MGAAAHSIATFTIIFVIAGLALAASDLAFAFEVTGCTTGVMICFCLPGCMYFSAQRAQRRRWAPQRTRRWTCRWALSWALSVRSVAPRGAVAGGGGAGTGTGTGPRGSDSDSNSARNGAASS